MLATRVVGDADRPAWMRAAAAAVAPALGLATYISLSRGALAATAAGLVVVVAAAPTWSQLRAAAVTVGGSAIAAAASAPLAGFGSLSGSLGTREREGLVMLVLLVALGAVGAGVTLHARARERTGRARGGRLPVPRRAPALAAALVLGAAGLFIAIAARERGAPRSPSTSAGASRLRSFDSNRYAYWRVALRSFEHHPLRGVGTAGFRVEWLRERPFHDPAQDAHSLYLETATELGVVGLALLALFLAGIALSAREAMRRDPTAAAGWLAAATVWAVHAGVDWDWEMPAVSLIAILLAGAMIARAEAPAAARAGGRASPAAPPAPAPAAPAG